MSATQEESSQIICVVMFGSGPILTQDAKQFICRLEDHAEISFLGAFCQSDSQTVQAVFKDLWTRRGILALPLFMVWIWKGFWRKVTQPKTENYLNQKLSQLSGRIHFVQDIHAQEVLDQVKALHPDLGLIYGSPILKPKLFEIPRLGTLGIHHGKVPEYRGNKTTFWAMYNGEKTAGVTIQKINAGLDTGEIVNKGEVPIASRSHRLVWRDLEKLGFDLYIQSILEVKEGIATFQPQIGPKGKLYRNPKTKDFIRFWFKQINRRLKTKTS